MLEIILEASLTYSKHTKQAGLDDRIKRLREVEQKFFAKIYPTLRYSQGITTSKAAELTGKNTKYDTALSSKVSFVGCIGSSR